MTSSCLFLGLRSLSDASYNSSPGGPVQPVDTYSSSSGGPVQPVDSYSGSSGGPVQPVDSYSSSSGGPVQPLDSYSGSSGGPVQPADSYGSPATGPLQPAGDIYGISAEESSSPGGDSYGVPAAGPVKSSDTYGGPVQPVDSYSGPVLGLVPPADSYDAYQAGGTVSAQQAEYDTAQSIVPLEDNSLAEENPPPVADSAAVHSHPASVYDYLNKDLIY